MKIIKLFRILFCALIYILLTLVVNLFFRGKNARLKILACLNRDLASSVSHAFNIKIELQGNMPAQEKVGNFVVSNHLSYLDGFILGSIFKVVYVSKKQVKSWPFFGLIARLGGTVFIDREKKYLSPEYVADIKEALKGGVNILLFPEGTSTNGEKTLPFQSLFFSSPIQAEAGIIPVTIFYTRLNGRDIPDEEKDRLHWYGQVPFHIHLWQVLSIKRIGVCVIIHDRIEAGAYENHPTSRHELAGAVYNIISGVYPKTNA